ncbi:MAG: nitronate monooxygenase [Chloroflexi bacterium]|nr:nitronate monooxygenase [Chloroflexota bacterium]
MLKTRATTRLGVTHPVILGGMGAGTSPALVAAVSNAGGLGIQGCAGRTPEEIARLAETIRGLTERPFGLNLLLFLADEAAVAAVLTARPTVLSTAWAGPTYDLAGLFARAHDAGALVMHMVSTVAEAHRAAAAGADVIVAQGTEGGGHVGLMGTMVLVPMVARALPNLPVLAAGGVADGAGLAAALMLGADGVLLGTRFLATPEAPLPASYKQVIVESDGHNTLVTEIPDIASGNVWPGAYARVERNRFVERWLGREGELRYRQAEVAAHLRQARATGDVSEAILYTGQTAGLIDAVEPAATIVERVVAEATALLRGWQEQA